MKGSIPAIALIAVLYSCNSTPSSRLDKLKQQQAAIAEEIRNIESEQKDTAMLDTASFRFVGVTEIRKEPYNHYIRVQGKVDGDQNVSVFAEVPGTVSRRFVNVGQKVSQGQILAQLDDSQVRKQLETLETQYKFASEMFEKQQRLWDQKIGSEVQYLQSRTNKESLERQIASLNEQINKFRIISPINGTVEEVNIKPGMVVSPDPRMAAFRVVAFNNMKVSAEVSEAYSSRVNAGEKLLISFPDIKKEVEAKVDFVSKYINPVNRTFIIEAAIPAIENLKANMVAIIRINDYSNPEAIKLPMNVIQNDLSGSYVYVVDNDNGYRTAVRQKVTVGNSYNGVAEITSGLNEGDLVVSTGFQDLVEGEYIRFGLQAME
ncbi:MAG TPA: efflux RND transporter periplasmic adaptor subunit [Bacteroidales bacterium]|nr:efflux RND transporter periplasmic adaptor subunit [Bacteroidales bacterium]